MTPLDTDPLCVPSLILFFFLIFLESSLPCGCHSPPYSLSSQKRTTEVYECMGVTRQTERYAIVMPGCSCRHKEPGCGMCLKVRVMHGVRKRQQRTTAAGSGDHFFDASRD